MERQPSGPSGKHERDGRLYIEPASASSVSLILCSSESAENGLGK
jgi:hypothetical protein